MDNKTFVGLLEQQVELVKNASDEKSENDGILKTLRVMLERLKQNCSSKVLDGYSQSEMRRLFSSFGNVAQAACDFYGDSKTYLDPAALQGEIGRKLESASAEIKRITALLADIERDNSELLEKDSELAKRNSKYTDLQERIKELNEIYEVATDERIASLKTEAEQLSQHITRNKQEASILEGRVNERKMDLASLHETYVRLDNSNHTIEENIVATIQQKHDEIKDIYSRHSRDLDTIISEIERYKTLYANLKDDVENARTTCDTYMLHLGENSDIVRKLQEYDITSVEGLLSDIKRTESGLKAELKRFDEMIRKIIQNKEKL